jgi:uncharacterized protein YjbI with pentapeptide repeats
MSNDLVNLTLPMTQQGLNVVLTTVGVAVLCGAVYLMLASMDQKGRARGQRWLEVLGWVFAPVWLVLFVGTMWQVWLILNQRDSALSESGLGAGALIAALLGAPFVIWGTWLRHKTQRLEQEGHMTDRITKAVEQLGAEKTIERIGRSVRLSLGNPEELNLGEQLETKTVIEWQGAPINSDQGWWVAESGEWKVFSETVPNLEVRIGAILSLERIAQDSTILDKGRDHVRVMEILCSYIQENSKSSQANNDNPRTRLTEIVNREFRRGMGFGDDILTAFSVAYSELKITPSDLDDKARQWTATLHRKIRPDIQIAIKVIGRRTVQQIAVERNLSTEDIVERRNSLARLKFSWVELAIAGQSDKFDLFSTLRIIEGEGYSLELSSVNFQGYDLTGLDLSFANIQNCRFEGAKIVGTNFTFAKLNFGVFDNSLLDRAIFYGSDLNYASIQSCTGHGVNFFATCSQGTSIFGGVFSHSEFIATHLAAVRFISVNLSKVTFFPTYWSNMDIRSCQISGARFYHVDFDQFSHFSGNTMKGALFSGVNFEKMKVTQKNFEESFGDASVSLADFVKYPAHWPSLTLSKQSIEVEYHKWLSNPKTYTPPQTPDAA